MGFGNVGMSEITFTKCCTSLLFFCVETCLCKRNITSKISVKINTHRMISFLFMKRRFITHPFTRIVSPSQKILELHLYFERRYVTAHVGFFFPVYGGLPDKNF